MLVWLLKDLFIELIGWYVGWPIVRVLTLGRYPEEGIHDSGEAGTLIYCIVSLTGLIVLGALGFSLL